MDEKTDFLTFVFRVDGGSSDKNRPRNEQGMGHISRSLVLAEYLKESGFKVVFLMKALPGRDKVKKAGFDVCEINENELEEEQINRALEGLDNPYLIIDKLDVSSEYVEAIKPYCKKIITADNKGSGAMCSDLNLYSLVEMPKGAEFNSISSPNLILLREGFLEFAKKEKIIKEKVEKVLVSMGGTDPTKTSLKVIKALRGIPYIEVWVVVGHGFSFEREIEGAIGGNGKFKILKDVSNMQEILFDVDIAIIGGGVTVFESAFIGTPSIVICHNQGEVEQAFKNYDICLNLGLTDNLNQDELSESIASFMEDYEVRVEMSKRGKSLLKEDPTKLTIGYILSN